MITTTHRKTKEVLIIFRVNVLFTLLSVPLHYFPLDLWLQLKLIYDLDSTFSSLSLIIIILGHQRQEVPGEDARLSLDSVSLPLFLPSQCTDSCVQSQLSPFRHFKHSS